MATWTFLATVSELFGVRHPAYLNNKLYFIDSQDYLTTGTPTLNPGGDIYEIDPAGPTQTLILDASAFASGAVYIVWSLASFGGNLYASVEVETNPGLETSPRIYRYDGTPGSWTQVTSTAEANAQFAKYNRLYSQSDVLVWYIRGQGDNNGFVFYSANGSSWSTGSISGVAGGVNSEFEFDYTVYWPIDIYETICVTDLVATCTDSDVYSFNGTALVSFQASPADVYLQSSPNGNVHFGGGGFYKLSLDMSTADLLDANIGAFMLMNAVSALVGADKLVTTTQLYTFDGASTWDSLETMNPHSGINPLFDGGSGWIANGTSKAWL